VALATGRMINIKPRTDRAKQQQAQKAKLIAALSGIGAAGATVALPYKRLYMYVHIYMFLYMSVGQQKARFPG